MLTVSSEFQRAQEEEARAAAAKGDLDLHFLMAKGDADLQAKQIAEAIAVPAAVRPIAVVVEPAAAGFEDLARTVLRAGIGWVLASDPAPYLDVLRREFPGQLVAWSCANNEEVGRLQARLAKVLLPNGGNVLALEGPSAVPITALRRKGLEDGFRSSEFRIVAKLPADWKPDVAQKAVEGWLQKAGEAAARPDLIVSQNDEMVAGALRTLRVMRPDWPRIPAIGCDGLPGVGQKMVHENSLAATIINTTAPGAGVELLVRARRGEQVAPGLYTPIRPFPSLEELRTKQIAG